MKTRTCSKCGAESTLKSVKCYNCGAELTFGGKAGQFVVGLVILFVAFQFFFGEVK